MKNSFETQVKKQLSERELKPTDKSWEQLRSKLDKTDRKRKKPYYWMAVAASFAIGVFLMSVLFSDQPTTQIVVENKENTADETPQLIPKTTPENAVVEVAAEQPQKENQFKTEKTKQTAHTTTKNELRQAPDVANNTSEILVEKEMLNQVIADVMQQQEDNTSLTDAEVDALLAEATDKIVREKQFKHPDDNISATALLEDVEMELEQSFREKVFDVLKNSYLKTKEAVASRND